MTQSRTIVLHGALAHKYGNTVTVAGADMRQVMAGLVHRFGTEFREEIRQGQWHIVNGDVRPGNDLGEEHLARPLSHPDIHILPAVTGASGALRVVIGIVLIAVGVYFKQTWLINIGASMVLGGVVEMLTKPPTPSAAKIADEGGGSIFNSAQNVTTQGGPVPLIFGRVRRASLVVIGTDFSADEVRL